MNNFPIHDELNHAIEQLIAEPSSSTALPYLHPRLAELMAVARDLKQLPRPDFKTRLKLELEWQAAGRAMSNPVPAEKADSVPQFGKNAGLYPVRSVNLAASAALHIGLLLCLSAGVVMVKNTARIADQNVGDAHKIGIYLGGGGGGGAQSKTNVSHGESVPFARKQIVPPVVEIAPSKIQVEARVIGPPDLNVAPSHVGDPLSSLLTPSGGPGVRSGVGSGDGGGTGSGNDRGHGPGSGGGEGGKFYLPGNGVTAPRAIYSPEPDYSDEARHTRLQGVVTLVAVIGPDGRPRQVQVARSLGMGLDEKAKAAVRMWRFEPGLKDGHPVAVQIFIEVDFRLF